MNVGEDAAAENDELEIDDIEDDIVEILREYQKRKIDKIASAEVLGNPRHQKRSKFESEEQTKESNKLRERKFWLEMKTVLSDKKLNVWKALEQSLAKYYNLLVNRKELIEEISSLNQQG